MAESVPERDNLNRLERQPEKTGKRAEATERAEIHQIVEKHTEQAKRNFAKPKEANSSGISQFGFKSTESLTGGKPQKAADHFENLSKQDKLDRQTHQHEEFQQKFGDPEKLQGDKPVSPEKAAANSPTLQRAVEAAGRVLDSVYKSGSTPDWDKPRPAEAAIQATSILNNGSLYSDGIPERPSLSKAAAADEGSIDEAHTQASPNAIPGEMTTDPAAASAKGETYLEPSEKVQIAQGMIEQVIGRETDLNMIHGSVENFAMSRTKRPTSDFVIAAHANLEGGLDDADEENVSIKGFYQSQIKGHEKLEKSLASAKEIVLMSCNAAVLEAGKQIKEEDYITVSKRDPREFLDRATLEKSVAAALAKELHKPVLAPVGALDPTSGQPFYDSKGGGPKHDQPDGKFTPGERPGYWVKFDENGKFQGATEAPSFGNRSI